MSYDYDLFVIGGGSGGIAAARRAAEHGAKVGLAEYSRLGGTCVHRGCIPKKLMVYASHFPADFEDAQGYGWSEVKSTLDWQKMMGALNQELERLNGVYQRLLDQAQVDVYRDRARFVDPHTLAVGETKVTADKILIAVGGASIMPEIPGIEHAVNSDAMFELAEQPQRLVIIGGGYIGVEFACIFKGLGTEVTMVIRQPLVLKEFDIDLRTSVQEAMSHQGIRILENSRPVQIEKTPAGMNVKVEGKSPEVIPADVVLAATGRSPNLKNLGLEKAEVATDQGAIAVDKYHRTSQPHIYAVGDCTNRKNLTPVAIREGRAFADTVFGTREVIMDYENIPSAVFSTPEAATVGLTEAEAKERCGEAGVKSVSGKL